MSKKTNVPQAEQVALEAIKIMTREMTDRICLIIEGDRGLQKKYLDAVDEHGLRAVNVTLAKVVKEQFGLQNDLSKGKGGIEKEPRSKLLQSYTRFVL